MTNYTPDIDIATAKKQQMFDFMLNHLRSQGGPSTSDPTEEDIGESVCMYRGDNGLMCAIGCMIPDSMYKNTLEGESADIYLRKVGVSRESDTRSFLKIAQSDLHDDIAGGGPDEFLTSLEENAIELAKAYKLKYTPPVTQQEITNE